MATTVNERVSVRFDHDNNEEKTVLFFVIYRVVFTKRTARSDMHMNISEYISFLNREKSMTTISTLVVCRLFISFMRNMNHKI